MKSIKKCLALCLALLYLLLVLAGCAPGPEREIRRLTDSFCNAYNEMDINAMLNCLEPDLANVINGMVGLTFGLAGSITGVDLDIDPQLLYDMISVYVDIAPEQALQGQELPLLDIELEDIEVSGDGTWASATAQMSLLSGSQEESGTCTLYYVCYGDEWYISNQNFTTDTTADTAW